MVTSQKALAELLRYLKAASYHFVAVTPATHARVLSRPAPKRSTLRDIFGWNRKFDPSALSPGILDLLRAADAVGSEGGKFRSKVRVASLADELLLHSAFPTDDVHSVFFGPDSYRFTHFVQQQLPRLGHAKWLIDMGAGSGAGAIASAKVAKFEKITMIDTNVGALDFASINAQSASVKAETLLSDAIPGGADVIIANPPYMMDAAGRSYRDGGDLLGGAVTLDWARQATACLAPGGAMLLYTGAAYVDGHSPLLTSLATACAEAAFTLELSEIDPDVFGEELDRPHYGTVERIAAVGAVIRRAPV